jgi:hypothetical protein
MAFATAQTNKMFLDSSGNLTLQTNQGADTALEIYNTSSSASAKASLKVGYDSANHLHIYRAGNAAGIVYNATQSGSSHQFQIAGSPKATLDATGLGIGTASPSTKIHASGASSASALRLDESTSGANSYLGYLDTSGNFGIDVNGGGYLRFAVGGAERVRLTSAGNFGIGSQSPTYKLVVSNGGAAGYEFNVNGLNGGVNTVVYNRSTSAYVDSAHFALNYYIYTGSVPAEVLRATSAGEVWIKNTSDQGSYNLQVGGTGVWGAGAYVNGSDERLKKSIATYTDNALDLVNQMRPVTFEYVEDYSDDRATQMHLNVAYQSLIPILTKAIQDLTLTTQELTARIEALEAA